MEDRDPVRADSLSDRSAWIGYSNAPVKYRSTSVLVVESELPALVEETLETAGMEQYSAFVGEQAQLLRDPQVLFTAFEDPSLEQFRASRPDLKEAIFSNLRVENPSRSSLVNCLSSRPGSQFRCVGSECSGSGLREGLCPQH